jgi:hypothetical protein
MPVTTKVADFLSMDRALIWTGAGLGLRIHPVNKFFIDPFVGIDFGWIWMFYTRTDEIKAEDIGNIDPDLIPDEFKDYAKKRTVLSLNGFDIAPQIGVNVFLTRNVALGILFEWSLPFWNQVCLEYELTPLSIANGTSQSVKGDKCAPLNDAAKLQEDADYLKRLPDKPPWLISVQANLAFLI